MAAKRADRLLLISLPIKYRTSAVSIEKIELGNLAENSDIPKSLKDIAINQ